MKRNMPLIVRLTLVTLAVLSLALAQRQTEEQAPGAERPSTNATNGAQPVKRKGKNLVAKLPDGVEGVTLESGFIKLKPGYKFVKGENGRVSVNLMRGGGGLSVGGSFDCSCASKEENAKCKLGITSDRMTCFDAALYCIRCELTVIVNETATKLIAYETTHQPVTGHTSGKRTQHPFR